MSLGTKSAWAIHVSIRLGTCPCCNNHSKMLAASQSMHTDTHLQVVKARRKLSKEPRMPKMGSKSTPVAEVG